MERRRGFLVFLLILASITAARPIYAGNWWEQLRPAPTGTPIPTKVELHIPRKFFLPTNTPTPTPTPTVAPSPTPTPPPTETPSPDPTLGVLPSPLPTIPLTPSSRSDQSTVRDIILAAGLLLAGAFLASVWSRIGAAKNQQKKKK